MRIHHARVCTLIAAALAALLVTTSAIAGSGKRDAHHKSHTGGAITNYGVIWEGKLTRSGLPDADSGWDSLRARGVKSIVTFREETDVDYGRHGFTNVLRIPLSSRVFPTERQAEEYLAFIQDPKNQPVHIHCAAGRDRTGMMAALARYAVDAWPLDKALAEAQSYRGGRSLEQPRVDWLDDK
jgi:hypothetical protein